MEYMHYEVDVKKNEVIRVTLDKQANVLLMDSANYYNFCNKKEHEYQGGFAVESPVFLTPKHAGHWHVVVHLTGT
ncbi:MAG: hypothetical protein A2161_10610, partial [Candidatus Schekmanbacteria bacterium RBG_13_48_7]